MSTHSRQTTYTYVPSGTPSVSGTANDWPFLFEGGEHEFTDPGSLYYDGSGNYYNPQIVRSLSETSQTSSQGSNGGFSPSGMAIPPPSGSSGGLSPQSVENDSRQALQVGTDIYVGASVLGITYSEIPIALPLAIIGGAIDFLVNFFEDLFGGGGSPTIPRQLLHARHPLYPLILGFPEGLIPTEGSAGPTICPDTGGVSKTPALQKQGTGSMPGTNLSPSLAPFNPYQGPSCTEPPPPPCNPLVPYFVGRVGATGGALLSLSLRLGELPQLAAPAAAVGATLLVVGVVGAAACQAE